MTSLNNFDLESMLPQQDMSIEDPAFYEMVMAEQEAAQVLGNPETSQLGMDRLRELGILGAGGESGGDLQMMAVMLGLDSPAGPDPMSPMGPMGAPSTGPDDMGMGMNMGMNSEPASGDEGEEETLRLLQEEIDRQDQSRDFQNRNIQKNMESRLESVRGSGT
jgi:hypothetical protein